MNEAKMLLDDLNKACEEYIEKEGMKNESW
jgi:hypothetical protein